MAKWDKARDYYADLELPASATSDDVKRQFKKLALKYHPDRNPGREAEVNPKFQIIQSAHEILTDETLRRQYDEARRSRSRFPGASGVRGNPWQDAAKAYPPPPKRQPNTQSRADRPSGGQRYEGFAGGMPRNTRPQSPKDDTQFRRSNAEAWDNIRPNRGRANASQRPATPGRAPPGRAPTSATRDSRPGPAPAPPPRTAYQKKKAEAAFGSSSSKKTGFTPRSPAVADEPPVTGKNYFTDRSHSNLFSEPDNMPQQPPTEIPIPPPIPPLSDRFMDRQRTPYHTPGGEKTSPFESSQGLGRSTSTRVPSRGFDAPGTFAHARPRSSSPARKPSNQGETEDQAAQSRAGQRYQPKMPETTDQPPQSTPNGSTAAQPNGSRPTVFNIPEEPKNAGTNAGFENFFPRSSGENINTSFVGTHDSDDWQFKAGSASAHEEASMPPKSRPQSRNRPAQRQNTFSRPTYSAPLPEGQDTSKLKDGEQGFSAGMWNDQIGSQHFEPQTPNSASASPTRRAHMKKSKSFKMTAGTAAVVDDESSEEGPGADQPSPTATPMEPDAMDIDTPPVERAEETPNPVHANGARKYSTEPYREDWRAGVANGVPPNPNNSAPAVSGLDGNISASSIAQPKTDITNSSPLKHGGSEDSDEFRATFSDLRNVEPFKDPMPSGLHSFADLKSTLPFESRPSEHINPDVKSSGEAIQPLAFPHPPVAPRPPPTIAVSAVKPTISSFKKYAEKFHIYMEKWETFNNQVLAHFTSRQEELRSRRLRRGANWLEDHVTEHLIEVEQDLDVQKKYADACAEHRRSVAQFKDFRDRVW
ncbi:hypothetical protein F4808DRAFT_316660 [Astrocystis sublimbata]|nr:hypothetical protein F4808DRAFT_316660 [Astrocystis sublimbata]